jgi:hypothetical protein
VGQQKNAFSAGAPLWVQLGPAVEPQRVATNNPLSVVHGKKIHSPSISEDSVVGLSVAEKKQVSSLRRSDEGPIRVRQ